jgi:hypothetical protein
MREAGARASCAPGLFYSIQREPAAAHLLSLAY